MYSTVNPDKVGFSKGARVFVGPVNAEKNACTPVGLLGQGITLSMEKTYRTKNDHFPEVEVASAVQTLTMQASIVLREWKRANLMLALDVANADVTDVPATPVPVVDEAYTVPANGIVVIPRAGLTSIVVKEAPSTTLDLDDDYIVVENQGQTLIVAVAGGDIAPTDSLLISYTYTPLVHTVMPLGHSGPRNYYAVWFEEDLTTSATARTEYRLYRAAIGLEGGFNINSAEEGGDLPVLVAAALFPGQSALGLLYNYE